MPPALDRLLASPSALRLLRSILTAPEVTVACIATPQCCFSLGSRRGHSTDGKPRLGQNWKRWHEKSQGSLYRDRVREGLQDGTAQGVPAKGPPTLVDRPELVWDDDNRDASWAVLLARQERIKRLQGIRTIWKAMRFRGYRLPTDDTHDARFLWGTLIKNPGLVREVIDHAAQILRETGSAYPHLYSLVMEYWLPRQPADALEYHHQMLVRLSLQRLPLRELVRSGRLTYQRPAFEALMDIYRNSNERDLYDEIVSALIERNLIDVARRWHSLCTFRTDLPSEAMSVHPLVRIFMTEASTISETTVHFGHKSTQKSPSQPKQDREKYNQELLQRLLGRDCAPIRFEDSFCARMFATRSFPPSSIIQGLSMAGVNEIGPQAVLAMASRTLPISELPARFEELRAAGIALRGCVFSLALEKFSLERKWQLVRSMLDSDQHPDVFGDADVQRKLLEFYLQNEDDVQAQRTLAILTLFHNDSATESWNLLLQVYVKSSNLHKLLNLLQDMHSRKIMLTKESIVAVKGLLRPRQRGHKPGPSRCGRFDDLRFVTRVYMSILEFGMGSISPSAWREIVRRFGMLGRFRELKRLLLWLLCWYAPRSSHQFTQLPKPPFLESATNKLRIAHPERNHYFHFPATISQSRTALHPVRQLFKPSLQQGLITWGFRTGILPNAHLEQSMLGTPLDKKRHRRRLLNDHVLRRLDWSVGLRFVVQLRDLGVYIHRHTVLKALQAQFVVMFGRGGKSHRKENMIVKSSNTKSYSSYVEEVNEIWGSPLFTVPSQLRSNKLHKNTWNPRRQRQIKRDTQISLRKTLGPDWQRSGSEDAIESISDVMHGDTVFKELQKHFVSQEKAASSAHESTFDPRE
ncbi:hypothetical protein ACN47E_008678 [Coniothyrium glycines]